jgi:acyl-CoA synthetase (NDP forming)
MMRHFAFCLHRRTAVRLEAARAQRIVGVSCDPQLRPVLLFGSGGLMVEVCNDVARRGAPSRTVKHRP